MQFDWLAYEKLKMNLWWVILSFSTNLQRSPQNLLTQKCIALPGERGRSMYYMGWAYHRVCSMFFMGKDKHFEELSEVLLNANDKQIHLTSSYF